MPLAATKTLPPIPTALRRGMSDVEFHAFCIAKKDRSELARQASRPNAGVSWSGMSDHSTPYVGMTDAEVWAEAEAKVSASVRAVA